MDACQDRFGMKSKNPMDKAGSVLSHLFNFLYCDVCFTVYSLLADSGSVYKQDYAYGTRGAVVDFQTGEMYCNRNRHNYRGSCHKQPLRKVKLLGNVLSVNGNMVTMCGQKKCGRPYVINKDAVTNIRGRSCCYCTQKLQRSCVSFQGILDYYAVSDKPRRCAVCAVVLQKTADVYVYPFRIYVCRKHHSQALVAQCKEVYSEMQADGDPREESVKRNELEDMIICVALDREASFVERKVKLETDKRKFAGAAAQGSNKRSRNK